MSFRRFAVAAAAFACACSTKNERLSIAWPPADGAASAIALLADTKRNEVLSVEVDAPFDQPLIFSLPEVWEAQPAEIELAIASYSCTLDQLGYGPAERKTSSSCSPRPQMSSCDEPTKRSGGALRPCRARSPTFSCADIQRARNRW